MRRLVTFTTMGLLAQMVDGSLGMAYGATTATMLVAAGYAPAMVSASVHLAEVGTTMASGASHWRFGNVDWGVVRRIAVPGALGAFAGATVLSSVDGAAVAPWTASILLGLGVVVLVRFAFGVGENLRRRELSRAGGTTLGLLGGLVDAIGGGGWGPIVTPTLITATPMEPRRVVGSVDTSEFVVSVAASAGFLLGLGSEVIDGTVVAGLLVGGLVAAPVAAWLVRRLATVALGVGVGSILILTNTRTLVDRLDVNGAYVYPAVIAVLSAAAVSAWLTRSAREPRLVVVDQ